MMSENEVTRIGRELYEKLRAELEAKHPGKYIFVALSGEYVIADTASEGIEEFKTRFPNSSSWVRRIGPP